MQSVQVDSTVTSVAIMAGESFDVLYLGNCRCYCPPLWRLSTRGWHRWGDYDRVGNLLWFAWDFAFAKDRPGRLGRPAKVILTSLFLGWDRTSQSSRACLRKIFYQRKLCNSKLVWIPWFMSTKGLYSQILSNGWIEPRIDRQTFVINYVASPCWRLMLIASKNFSIREILQH